MYINGYDCFDIFKKLFQRCSTVEVYFKKESKQYGVLNLIITKLHTFTTCLAQLVLCSDKQK